MKKNVVIGIVVVFIIIGIILVNLNKNGETINCDDFENVYDMVECYAQKALTSNNSTICESIPPIASQGSFIAECYKQYALETLDSKYCKARWSLSIADECAYEIAVKTDNVTHCENAGSDMFNPYLRRDNCYTRFAVFKKDKLFCEELTEEHRIIDCYTEVARASEQINVS